MCCAFTRVTICTDSSSEAETRCEWAMQAMEWGRTRKMLMLIYVLPYNYAALPHKFFLLS